MGLLIEYKMLIRVKKKPKTDTYDFTKVFAIVMSINTPKTMTEQQRYRQKCLEKSRRYYEENRLYKKWFLIDTKHCFKRKKGKKDGRNRYQITPEQKRKIIQKSMSEEDKQKKRKST